MYLVMEKGEVDLGTVMHQHKKAATFTVSMVKYFWEAMLLVWTLHSLSTPYS